MGRKIAIIISVLSLVLVSCSSIDGLYIASYEGATGLIQEELHIKRDNSFAYYPPPLGIGVGGIYDSTIGTWKKKGKNLILNSESQDTTKYYIEEVIDYTLSLDSIQIKVYDLITKKPIKEFGIIIIYDSTNFSYYSTNQNGEVIISKNILFDKFAFPRISSIYSLVNRKSNLLILNVRQYIYSYMINESFEVSKDKLIQKNNGYKTEYIKVK